MDIKISKSARICRETERDFVHGELVYSVVRIQENEFVREDYCADAWRPERARDAYSHWSTKYYDPRVAEQEPAEAFSPLRQLFYEAVEAEDRVEQAKAFLAAQLLRRQKVFRQIKESDEIDGEVKIVLFNDRIGNRLIEVRDPNFSYAELEAGRLLLVQRLRELETADAPPSPTALAEAITDSPQAAPEDESELDPTEDATESEDSEPDDADAGVGEDSDDEDDDDEEYDEDEFDDDDDDDEDDEDDEDEDVEELDAEESEAAEADEEESTKHV